MLPTCPASYPRCVPELLVVTDSLRVFEEVRAAVEEPGVTLRWARLGSVVVPALEETPADLVICDLQVGSMGGYAVAMDIALETGAGRLVPTPVLLLLDRRADVFLARRNGVAGWLVKPLDPLRLRRAVERLLAGEEFHDPTLLPTRAGLMPD